MILALAALIAAPVAAQTIEPTPIVIGQSYRLPSQVLGAQRVVNVWTPPSYGEGERTYPVLYVIDGGIAQDFHHMSGLAQLGTWGTMQEMIVVGIETVDRRREPAFPPVRDSALRRDYPTAGGSRAFHLFLATEVKPFIARRYRASGEDAVIGESLAGLFIVETFLRAPGTFDRYVAISPSLWWDDMALADEAAALLARHDGAERTLWLTVADEGGTMQEGMDRLVAALRAGAPAGLRWTYEPRHAESHATIYHGAALDALRILYPPPAAAAAE